MPAVELTLAPATSSVAAARRFLTTTLDAWAHDEPVWDDVAWAATQALSELATNAVLHAGTPFTVALSAEQGQLRLEVRDGSRRDLHQHRYGLTATTGRGLALVDALSTDWGVRVEDGGKVVWCLLAPGAGPAGGLGHGEPDLDDLHGFLSDAELEAL